MLAARPPEAPVGLFALLDEQARRPPGRDPLPHAPESSLLEPHRRARDVHPTAVLPPHGRRRVQCRLPKCTHKTFVEKCFQTHKESVSSGVLVSVPRGSGLLSNEGFVVRHYAGQVLYHSANFLQKNNNSLHEARGGDPHVLV